MSGIEKNLPRIILFTLIFCFSIASQVFSEMTDEQLKNALQKGNQKIFPKRR